VRTITTNKTNIDAMDLDFKELIQKQVAAHTSQMIGSLLFDGVTTPLGQTVSKVHRRIDRVTTRSRIVEYDEGYWVKITVNDDDHVSYKLFNGGWLAKTFYKIGLRKVLDSGGWDAVKQRDTVEATLGATYMAIDEAIVEDLGRDKHSKFLKDMIKTDPENLKAIAQLDMLDKGDGPGTQVEPVLSASGVTATKTYGQNISVSGSGTLSKTNTSKPAVLGVGPMSLSGGGATSLSFGTSEEAMKVDPDGSVSFGNKMAEAIRKVTQEDKGETNGS